MVAIHPYSLGARNSAYKNSATASDDQADVKTVLAGDVSAFEGIVRRWQGPLINLAYRFCYDRASAEEMAHEAFPGRLSWSAPVAQSRPLSLSGCFPLRSTSTGLSWAAQSRRSRSTRSRSQTTLMRALSDSKTRIATKLSAAPSLTFGTDI